MNDCCYTIAIRQITCQNGIPRTIDNVYTNVEVGNIISLSFGYSIKILSINTSNIEIELSNPDYIPTLIFNIPVGHFRMFSLPKENGTLRVFIGAIAKCCKTFPVTLCCNDI